MADGFYLASIDAAFGGSALDLLTDTIKALFVDEMVYTPDLATDTVLDDIPVGARLVEDTLASKTLSGGVFDAADISLGATPAGIAQSIVLYQDTGDSATSRLIYRIDTGTGLPVVLGAGLDVEWNNGPTKILAIANTVTEGTMIRFTTDVKTVADDGYIMTAFEGLRFEASGGAWETFLPPNPARDQRVVLAREHATDSGALTVQGNGESIRLLTGGTTSSSIVLDTPNEYLELAYNGALWTPAIWRRATVRTRRLVFDHTHFNGAITPIGDPLPAGAIVIRRRIVVTTPFDGTVMTMAIGVAGDDSVMEAVDSDATTADVYAGTVHISKSSAQLAFIADNDAVPSTGDGEAVVEFFVP